VQGSTGGEPVRFVNEVAAAPSRLRVALDATPLLGQPTGVGAFCLGALQSLSIRADLDVRAFAVSWRRRGEIGAFLPANVSRTQRPMPARPLHALWGRGRVPPLEWFIGDVDVVHGTNFVVPPTRRAGAVVSVHDLTPLHHPELCNEATLAYPVLIRNAVQRGAWVHADSSFVAGEVMEAFAADPSRVRVVEPGVPALPALAPGESRRVVDALRPPGVSDYILAIGTAEPRKDLPGLVRAFDQLAADHPSLGLVLAGPPGWGEEALTAAIAQAHSAARILRTGWVDAPVLSALLTEASVLAYPSFYEGFGFPPLQAMATGVPVVATRAGSLPEVLADGAVLVEAGDADGLGGALARVLTDRALRQDLIRRGAARAAHFTWDRCGRGLAHLYGDVEAERHG
jgi:glycosyltransferase involved in cell wall biosynthesis